MATTTNKRKTKPKVISAKARNRKARPKSVSLHMVRRARSKKVHKQTGIELTVETWLTEAGATFEAEKSISRTHVDFYLPVTNTIVEVNGCYWHSCKKCNGADLTAKQKRFIRRDARRYTFFKNAGFNLVLLWEHEIEKDPDVARKKVLEHASITR